MIKLSRIFSLGLVLALACEDNPVLPIFSEEDEIREAVFRDHFAHNGSGMDTSAHFFFLAFALMDTSRFHNIDSLWDPPEYFMNRFLDNVPLVKKHSESTTHPYGAGVFDTATGLRGLRFVVGQIRYLSSHEVEVEGGYYAGGLNAEGDLFYLRKAYNRWWVYKRMWIWVS